MSENRLPLEAARDVLEKYDLDQVILIARDHGGQSFGPIVHSVTYGKTKQDCDMAAVDGEKLRRVIEGRPTSLEDALEMADSVRASIGEKYGNRP